MAVRTVRFEVQGEFITSLARSWYFEEHRPYEKAEELLLECMKGTDLDLATLKKYARGILMGTYKLTGNTRDDSFGMEDDGEFDPLTYYDEQIRLAKRYKEQIAEYGKPTEEELDDMTDEEYFNRPRSGWAESLLTPEAITTKQGIRGDYMLNEFLKARKEEDKFGDSYGWIEPNGTFHAGDWGTHLDMAKELVEKRHWKKEFNDYYKDHPHITDLGYEGGFLTAVKGWILLHSPSMGKAFPSYNRDKRLTKKQQDFLYAYYIKRGDSLTAERYLEEDN